MRWLITGGAGYIGAHVIRALRGNGFDAVVIDDLSTGVATRVPPDVPLVRADVKDTPAVRAAVARYRPVGVIHLAARKDVAESTSMPLRYYQDNLDGLRSILEVVSDPGLSHVIFSSSAAVYGTPIRCPVTETDPTNPENAYGRTKLIGEWMLRDAAAVTGFRWAALRYFNVAGAGEPRLRDTGTTNLLPRLLAAAREGGAPAVFGLDYPTRDGSPVRDYVHVADIADAHARAAAALVDGRLRGDVLNIGRGAGVTVLEMIEAVGRALGRPLRPAAFPRRPGDPAEVVACADQIRERLGWQARYGLDDMVRSAAGLDLPVAAGV